MSPDTIVCVAAICFALTVSITVLVATVVIIEGFAPRPKHRRPRRSPRARTAMPVARWSR